MRPNRYTGGYRLTRDGNAVLRIGDNANVPIDPGNADYQDYLAWVDAGGVPEPYVAPPTPEWELREQTFVADTERAEWLDQLRTATLAQLETFAQNKINADAAVDLATARACLKRMETGIATILKLIALSIRR